MKTKTRTTDKALARWENLLAGFEANKIDLGPLEGYCALLAASIKDLRQDLARRAALRTEVLQASRAVLESLRGNRELASRIRHGIKARYGVGSEKLVEFGLLPDLRGGGRKEEGAPRNPTVPSSKQ